MDAGLFALLIGVAVMILVPVAARRMSRKGGGVSSGLANVAADLDAILQPHHPNAEVIEKAKPTEEEDEDEGDLEDPPPSSGSDQTRSR